MTGQNITARAAVRTVTQTSRALGIDLPAKLATGLAQLDRVTGRDLREQPGTLGRLLVDAAIAGRDPMEDDALREYAIRAALRSSDLNAATAAEVDNRRAALLHKHAAAIVKTWAPVIATAGETIGTARQAMPDVDFLDPRAVIGLRAGQMTTWGEARDALSRVETIAQAWATLANATGLAHAPAGWRRALVVADATLADVDALEGVAEIRGDGAVAIAHTGHALALATFEQFAERVGRVTTERERRDAEAAERSGRIVRTA